MEQPLGSGGSPQGRRPRGKMNYACEACRAAKLKCQPGSQPGICNRCSESKRECVFRTGPRTRRPKASSRPESEIPPPPPGPSKTFSIDFDMPTEQEPDLDFEDLRQKHERFFSSPAASDEEGDSKAMMSTQARDNTNNSHPTAFSFNDLSSSPPPPSSTGSTSASGQPRPIHGSLGIKPQFNLDSAEKLLASFRAMLPHCPFVVLPATADVRTLARDAPFLLLAVLAVTSCSTSLQGHSLYDDEFRKIFGLKLVAGGERSLELLQGLLVYCTWYPFHLRPKSKKQALQFLRMAVDLVHDLELDRESAVDLVVVTPDRRARRLDEIRAFLGCYYAVSTYSWGWSRSTTLRHTSFVAKCSDDLEVFGDPDQDRQLVWLVRLQYILEELSELQKNFRGWRGQQSENHRDLIRMGLEKQLRDFQSRIPVHLARKTSILLLSQIASLFLVASPIMRPPRPKPEDLESIPLTASRLLSTAAPAARLLLDSVASLPRDQLACFSGPDSCHLIIAIILGYRLSFPVPGCAGYDDSEARRVLDFGSFLRRMSNPDDDDDDDVTAEGDGRGKAVKTDHVAALRVVLGAMREKYEKKVAALEQEKAVAAQAPSRRYGSGCPMLDGSLDQYITLWDGQQTGPLAGSYATSQSGSSAMLTEPMSVSEHGAVGQIENELDKPMVFHDLWATMTMGWPADAEELGVGGVDDGRYFAAVGM
ncbi:hypothetical protein F5Y15DRAFT_426004 [Xylariaceae sp. FL0016]|nr:hypothetical protein F5Y15DRAFT_426004 [Xylariaceae sp. FL0016]